MKSCKSASITNNWDFPPFGALAVPLVRALRLVHPFTLVALLIFLSSLASVSALPSSGINPTDFFTGAKSRPKIEILYPLNGQILDSENLDIKIRLYGHDFQKDSPSSDHISEPSADNRHGSGRRHDVNSKEGSVPYSSFSSNFHSSAICIGISNGASYYEQCFFELSYLIFSVTGLIPGDQYSLRVVYYERGNAIAVSVRNFKVGFISADLFPNLKSNDAPELEAKKGSTAKWKLSIKSALQIAFHNQFRDAPKMFSYSPSDSSSLPGGTSSSPADAASVSVVEAILSQVPGHPEALHYYSLLLLLRGNADLAKEMVAKAITNINDKGDSKAVPSTGKTSGIETPASSSSKPASTLIDTDSEEYKLSIIKEYSDSKDPRAIVDYLNTLGQCYRVLSKFEESEQTFISAITLHDNFRRVNLLSNNVNSYDESHHVAVGNSILFNLALLYKQYNYFEKAVVIYKQILNSSEVENNPEDKLVRYSSMVSLCDLMSTFTSGRETLSCYLMASVQYPHDKLIWNELGVSYAKLGLYDEAISSFTTSSNLNSTVASLNIAHVLEILGYYNESYSRYNLILDSLRGIEGLPTFHIQVRSTMILPRVLPSNASEVFMIRDRIDKGLSALLDSSLDRTSSETITDNSQPLSFGYSMGYHLLFHNGFNLVSNKNLKMKLSLVYKRLCPSLSSGFFMDKFDQKEYSTFQKLSNQLSETKLLAGNPGSTSAHSNEDVVNTIHVGVVSRYFYNHPIGIVSLGLLNELSVLCRDKDSKDHQSVNRFIVTVFTLNSFESVENDPVWRYIMSLNVNVVYLLQNIELSAKIIKSHNLDMIIYPELNSDPITYFLSHAEFSSNIVTAAWWIYPETSGISNIDYFMAPDTNNELTSDYMTAIARDPSDASNNNEILTVLQRGFVDDINFCEKLVKLPMFGAAFSDILKLLDPLDDSSNGGVNSATTSGSDISSSSSSSSNSNSTSTLSALVMSSGGARGINLFGRNLLLERLKFTEKLKLPKLAHIYLILSPLHYYNADHDALIRMLLLRDKLGYVAIMDSSITRPSWQRMFSRRVVGELPLEAQNRFLCYYPSSYESRLLFIAIAHVVLDIPAGLCLHCNLQALMLGTPVVMTVPSGTSGDSLKSRTSPFYHNFTLLLYQKLDYQTFKNVDLYSDDSFKQESSGYVSNEHVIQAGSSAAGLSNSSDFPCVDIEGESNFNCARNDKASTEKKASAIRDSATMEIVTSVSAKSYEDMVYNAIKIAHKPKLRDSISQFINERRNNLFKLTNTMGLGRGRSGRSVANDVSLYETLIPEMIRRKRAQL